MAFGPCGFDSRPRHLTKTAAKRDFAGAVPFSREQRFGDGGHSEGPHAVESGALAGMTSHGLHTRPGAAPSDAAREFGQLSLEDAFGPPRPISPVHAGAVPAGAELDAAQRRGPVRLTI